jgi:hypothetical protein
LIQFRVATSRFGQRFGYARWLKHLVDGTAPTHAEIGRAVGRTGPAVGAWLAESEPPSDWKVHAPLAGFLGVDEGWLVKQEGKPPRPELWREWLVARALDAARAEDPAGVEEFLEKERAASRPATARGAAKKAVGAGKGKTRR